MRYESSFVCFTTNVADGHDSSQDERLSQIKSNEQEPKLWWTSTKMRHFWALYVDIITAKMKYVNIKDVMKFFLDVWAFLSDFQISSNGIFLKYKERKTPRRHVFIFFFFFFSFLSFFSCLVLWTCFSLNLNFQW